jgi:pimeloyl-ACP methyl ester carboxylesterase
MLRYLALGVVVGLVMPGVRAAESERIRDIVAYDNVRIEIIVEGSGPPVLLLPGRGRDSEDFDELAAGIAKAGYRVLRPQPRGAGQSTGPMQNLTLHDFARDIAAVIRHESNRPAVIVGHAYGSWIARMTAVDTPQLVRGVVIAAAAARAYPAGFAGAKELSDAVRTAGDTARPEAERLEALRTAFFAPDHDPRVWLSGWHTDVDEAQFVAGRATKQSEWWSGGSARILDLQGERDPFKPRSMMNEVRDEFGERADIVVISDASHALIPEQPAKVVAAIVDWIAKLLPP